MEGERVKRLTILLFCVFAAVSAFAATAKAETSMKIAHATWVGYGPLYIASENGYFEKLGLDVELIIIEDESQYAAALASGNIDGLGNVLDREIIHYAKGTPETVILGMDESAGGDGIVASAEIKSLADLEGKTVALDKSSTSYFFFLTAIESAGLDEKNINITEMGASDAGAAFVAGRVDAAVTWEPWLTNANQREGGHVLVSSKDFPKTIVDVLVLRNDFIEKNPGAPLALTKAWNEAVAWYNEHPDEGNEIMGKAMGLDASEMADMASGVRFIGGSDNQDFFDKSKAGNIYEVAARAAKFWEEKGIIDAGTDIDALITDQYVKEATQ
ncbi:aliphatic sulfonate ABC transporter substrate-binding protein [Oceanidesulfovibrio marinus]|uniref:Aliphatic sulfonate ABC transporter substrate-binding protein n=1 Tax=Oceanidesulfovibrio marinus TaxID=370038 RepID=A0ABX6NAG7_9BACT|nr:aliphatic sulfonate ABC transporter substrate-binding protein [Oceanidesulfovibrio marinus]